MTTEKDSKEPTSDKEKNQDSMTEVNPSRGHGVGLWKNPRVVVGIRVDKGLYSAFKPVSQRVFGSVCLPLECFMAAIIVAVKAGNLEMKDAVNLGKTVSVDIDKIVIERNLRSRRGLQYSEPIGVTDLGSFEKCYDCGRSPRFVGFGREGNSCVRVFGCERHFNKSQFEGWREFG